MKSDNKIISSLYVEWEKSRNALMICCSNENAKYSGHDVAKAITKKIKEYAKDFDIANVRVEIKLKNKRSKYARDNI